MSKPTIVITGANGFLGTTLVEHFSAKGWQIIALVHGAKKRRQAGVTFIEYDMEKPLRAGVLKGADYLVHAAYIRAGRENPEAFSINVNAAARMVAASRKQKIKKNVFISSMSAHEDAISDYGRQKLQIEKFFNTPQDVVLRPGLIIGDGGIVKNMLDFMKSKHVVPLVAGGKQPLQIIGIKDLAVAIEQALTKDLKGTLTVAHPHVYTYKQFYRMVADGLKVKALFVPIPYSMMMAGLKAAERLPLNLGIGTDNLRGLKKLRSVDTKADIKKLGLKPKSLETCIRDLSKSDRML